MIEPPATGLVLAGLPLLARSLKAARFLPS